MHGHEMTEIHANAQTQIKARGCSYVYYKSYDISTVTDGNL